MILEAKRRLQSTELTAAFKADLRKNLESMSVGQRKTLCEAMQYVIRWFNGNLMNAHDYADVDVLISHNTNDTGAKVDMKLLANGFAWLSKVFHITQGAPSKAYRMHDMLYALAEKTNQPVSKLQQLEKAQLRSLMVSTFPVDSVVELTTNKPILSFTSDLKAIKNFSGNNGRKKLPTDVYLEASNLPVLFMNEDLAKPNALMKFSQSRKNYRHMEDIVNDPSVDNTLTAIGQALASADRYRHQKELVCQVKGKKFKARIVGYA
jgi:hypothetical protein